MLMRKLYAPEHCESCTVHEEHPLKQHRVPSLHKNTANRKPYDKEVKEERTKVSIKISTRTFHKIT